MADENLAVLKKRRKLSVKDESGLVCIVHYERQDTGTGTKRRMIDVKKVAAEVKNDVIQALPGFHAFTGCDTTSAFMRRGKRGPFKLLELHAQHTEVFRQLGIASTCLSDDDHRSLERFVCTMYCKPADGDVNKVRCDIFEERNEPTSDLKPFAIGNGIDLSLLPPCQSSLRMHSLRANYQAYIWKHAHIASVSVPASLGLAGCGWKRNSSDSGLEIDWTFGDIMPNEVADVLADEEEATNKTSESGGLVFELVEEDERDNIIDVVFDDEDDD
jgi:hypothetical protein